MGFRVLRPGSCSLLVDPGRPGHRHRGVPLGGAADRWSYVLGNALVGNASGAVALEFALAGPLLEATEEHHCVLAGAHFHAVLSGKPVVVGRTFQVHSGDVLEITVCEQGQRGYLCVHGGFESPMVLDSRSALEPLAEGVNLSCPVSASRCRFVPDMRWLPADLNRLRILPGPHFPLAGEKLLQVPWRVTSASNRMGLRLRGPNLLQTPLDLPSAPVCPGVVQATQGGEIIVLGVDAQTIGGYPRLAHVISADLDKLAQLRPGDEVAFELSDLASAEAASHQARREMNAWVQRLLTTWDG
ncbi:MAG: biotin-dependent carboxyltransferase family protein [Gemmatales bacterium]|nr:biotin-dependent carboxyltransferase family protein [Gemmatales bacterium]MDW8387717.1 biotin-dependent carboxyltransferase family protein [Gemmatales bacterium]